MDLVPVADMTSRMISLGYLSATVRDCLPSQFARRDPLKHYIIPIKPMHLSRYRGMPLPIMVTDYYEKWITSMWMRQPI